MFIDITIYGMLQPLTCQGIIALSVLPLGWGAAGDVIDYFGYDSTHEVASVCVCVCATVDCDMQ